MQGLIRLVVQGLGIGIGLGLALPLGLRLCQPQPVVAQEATPEVVRAKRFVLVDDQGTVRATLGMKESQPQFALIDTQNYIRAVMKLESNQTPVIGFADAKGRVRFNAGMGEGGGCGIHLYDEKVQPRAGMTMMVEGGALFYLSDRDGQRRQSVFLTPEDVPCFVQYDAKGNPRAGIRTDLQGNPHIYLLNPDTTPLWEAPPAK